MSEMMPEEDTTFFNYNDNWLNNIGTFAANELLGFDDFQRAFDNMENPNISFWDRAKSLGTGLAELGSTAATFIPGAGVAVGAAKLGTKAPALASALSKSRPLFANSPLEYAAGLGLTGASAVGAAAPEDSIMGTVVPDAANIGLLSLLGARGVSSMRNRRAVTPTTLQTGAIPGQPTLPGLELPTGAGVAAGAPAARTGVRRVVPKSGKGKLGAVIGTILAGGGLLGAGFLGRDDTTPTQAYIPSTLPGLQPPIPAGSTADDVIRIMRDAQNRDRQDILRARNELLSDFGAGERAALEDYLRVADAAGRSSAQAIRNQYQDFYDRLAGDVADIQGMGAAGEAAVSRRYRQAARRARREGARENIRSGVGGLTPVSGALADMPASIRGEGADLATYLRNNAAMAARDAGFDAETSLEYGNAMANQLAAEIALMGAGARYTTERDLATQERNIRAEYDAMLSDLTSRGRNAEAEFLAQEALRQRDIAEAQISGPELLASPAGQSVALAWSQISALLSGNVPEGTPIEYVQQAQRTADLLQTRYGKADLETYAQYFADNPEMIASLGGA